MVYFFLIFTLFAQPAPKTAPAAPETLSKEQVEESVFRCQMNMLSPEGYLPDAAACICRAKYNLKETPPCAAIRKGKSK